MKDPRGVPFSTGTAQSHAVYETALRAFNTYRGDPVAIIEGALATGMTQGAIETWDRLDEVLAEI